ncbi:hypothetical protein E4U43_008445 [Claviceps pusilla]|uniref:Uncharacterized protein n=1 Tax=Claviceps pusilla TaxID=123648 RepID=A0A9P7ND80_9HYPO|nr:hypothetical protein E4U43_008445 [Claviceps pusilla]
MATVCAQRAQPDRLDYRINHVRKRPGRAAAPGMTLMVEKLVDPLERLPRRRGVREEVVYPKMM